MSGLPAPTDQISHPVRNALNQEYGQGMVQLALELPDEVFSARKQPPRLFGHDLRLAAAMHWYARGEISMEKGALIAGLDRNDFLESTCRSEGRCLLRGCGQLGE